MTVTAIAQLFAIALQRQAFDAEPFVDPTPNGCGHKIALFETNPHMPGCLSPLGRLVVYAGKQGPRYVTNELSQPTPDILARIAQAWAAITLPISTSTRPSESVSCAALPSVPGGTIELWVDGACLSQLEGLKFGWAFVIQQGGQEVMRHASHLIESYMAPHRNVGAELQAVIHGLTHCREMGHQAVTVFYDYAGIEQWATRRWKANTRTTQEYVRFIADCPITITWQKVPAHSGIPMNELVDQLATGAAHSSNEHHSV